MSFVLDWQKKLGYKQDPFSTLPSKRVNDYIVGRENERERLNLFVIKQEKFGILHGPKGSGKTTMLRWLEQELKAHHLKVRVVLLQGKEVSTKKHFFERFLDESLNILERNVTKPQEKMKHEEQEAFVLDRLSKKRMVILVDNAAELQKENKNLLKELLEAGSQLQVLLSLERVLKEHEQYGSDKLHLELKEMPVETLKELIEKRISLAHGVGTFPFEQQHLKELVDGSKHNPVKLLELAKTRAIELSLKVAGPPKVERESLSKKFDFLREKKSEKTPVKKSKARKKESEEAPQQKAAPKKKGGWFSIKLVGDNDNAEKKSVKKEEMLDKDLVKPRDDKIDTDLLQELVEVGEHGASKEEHVKHVKKDVETSDVEDVIQSLVEEMDQKK